MSKQATLFRTWGGLNKTQRRATAASRGKGKAPVRSTLKKSAQTSHNTAPTGHHQGVSTERSTAQESSKVAEQHTHGQGEEYGFEEFQELDDFFEDDISDELAKARPDSSTTSDSTATCTSRGNAMSTHNTSLIEEMPGCDVEAGGQWIYPVNYPLRDYQFNIVQKCLFKNTLVCLPTGLGKTFIAAVVMYNFYRWYPQGKIVFLAPTKPLVSQQIEACHNIMGIPQTHLVEMTGNLSPKERNSQWSAKRVFFLTPQVMQNDITRGACLADQVCCVVFDEAHKALGNHSYCQVVRELSSGGGMFRVLALSATPGNDLKAVQQVVSNLLLSHIELRSDDSFDIQPYTHQRKVELNVVPLEGEILLVKNAFLKVLSGVVGRLAKHGVVYSANPERLSKFGLLQSRDEFRKCPPANVHPGTIESDFAAGISLYHAYDLLVQHGMRSFHQYLTHTFTSAYSRTKTEIDRYPELSRLVRELHSKLAGQGSQTDGAGNLQSPLAQTRRSPRSGHYTSPVRGSASSTSFFYSHPKLQKLEEVVLGHFRSLQEQSADGAADTGGLSNAVQTRVMIFSQYRESVQEIADMLSCHAPLVKVMSFVGHGTSSKSTSKGLTQREQTEVVRKFRDGGYNTLVATCVGEEGLDIGEVDLIVCFDAHKSPIRLVQRMGRTGRKRTGRIVVIVAQGKEEQIYRKSQSNRNSIHKAIRDNCRSLHFYPHAPRMLPRHISPQCLKMHMNIQQFVSKPERGGRGRGRRKGKEARLSFGPPAQSKAQQRGCLNSEELDYWSKNYSLPDRELRACEKAVSDCFKPHPLLGLSHLQKETASHSVLDSPFSNQAGPNCNRSASATPLNTSVTQKYPLSLSKWVRWQTGQTHFKMVGSSEKTKQFVSLLEFLDVMYSCEDLGESYSAEMATFLNREDIYEDKSSASSDTKSGAAKSGARGMVSSEECAARERVRACKRRRLPSDSSEDDDFRELGSVRRETEEAEGGVVCLEEPVVHGDSGPEQLMADEDTTSELDTEGKNVAEEVVEKSLQEASPALVNEDNDRGSLLFSQHAIPRPPSAESLDWLDNIEPSQISTPLPSSRLRSSPHRQQDSADSFQFVIPRTPPRGKTPVVTPLTAPLPSLRDRSTARARKMRTPQSADSIDLFSDTHSPRNNESVDLFADLSSGVLFEDFSDISMSHNPGPHREDPMAEAGSPDCSDSVKIVSCRSGRKSSHVRWDHDVTCIPDSEDEAGEGDGGGEGEGEKVQERDIEQNSEQEEISKDSADSNSEEVTDGEVHVSSLSEDSFIAVHGRRRARCARPAFLLTQAPPPDVCLVSSDSSSSVATGVGQAMRRSRRREAVTVLEDSSDEDEFVAPLRQLKKGASREEGLERERVSRDGWLSRCEKSTASNAVREHGKRKNEEFEFLDEEAELSQEGGGQNSEGCGEEEGEDSYDMEDSFINDNSVLTQITPSQLAGGHRNRARKTGSSPVNMGDVYRRSLMSPDTLFRGRERGRVGGDPYRMVLSQRHRILQHYMGKAGLGGGEGRKRLFSGEVEEGMGVSGEDVEGESEAEEVMVRYGEEDREELSESQSIGEPWDWAEEVEAQETGSEQEVETEEEVLEKQDTEDHCENCGGPALISEVVSPSLLTSVEVHSTPSCYALEVEGWSSADSGDEECLTAPSAAPSAELAAGLTDTELAGGLTDTELAAGLTDTELAAGLTDTELAAGLTDTELAAGLTDTELAGGLTDTELAGGLTDTEAVFLSQQELEQEFACFSNPASPQLVGSPQTTSIHAEPATACGSSPESIPSANTGMETGAEAEPHPLTLLASSKEASYTQVVSMLRHNHSVCVLLCPLGHGGYVVSGRMVVERREVGEVGSVSGASKLIGRLRELRQLYPRVCVILEEEAAKEGKKAWSRPSHYLETAVSRLHTSGVRVLFSQSHLHSASLLAALCSCEASRGHAISLTEAHMQAAQPAALQLLMKLPRMTYLTALSLCSAFTSLHTLLHCCVEDLRRRVPSLTERRARQLSHFFSHSFNHYLVP